MNIRQLVAAAIFYVCTTSFAFGAIYIDNLSNSISEQQLKVLFSEYGKVMKVSINENGHSAYIHMGNFSMEDEAIEALHHQKINGRKVVVTKSYSRLTEQGALLP